MHFTRANQTEILTLAAEVTNSDGWRADAIGFAATPAPGNTDYRAVAVFQNFDGDNADVHFGMTGGRRLGAEIVKAFMMVALSPRMLNLKTVWIQIAEANVAAQVAALKIGAVFEHRKRMAAPDGTDLVILSYRQPKTAAKKEV